MRIKIGGMVMALAFLLLGNGCKKCYTCKNVCKICTDNRYTIRVCSDVFTKKYFDMYIDSLTAPNLGWVCIDTNATVTKDFCSTGKSNRLFDETNLGFECSPK
jgi:hypothetical protein